ncbi:hypothetical protein JCM16303_006951 [Sporobolomyces ruberrimus]
MSDNPKCDYLSLLPYEIFSDILTEAYKDGPAPPGPISRAFLPFQRQALFRRVVVTSHHHLEVLMRGIERKPGLGGLVIEFRLVRMDEGKTTSERWTRTERRWKSFFSLLVNLDTLRADQESRRFIDFVLSPRIRRPELPRLRNLVLKVLHEWGNPSDSKIYRHLNAYPSIRRLGILLGKGHKMNVRMKPGQEAPNIKAVVLKGENTDDPETLSFLRNFPQLSSLTLDTLGISGPSYTALVSSLPTSLTSLTLLTFSHCFHFTEYCDPYLPRLANLEFLYLGRGTFSLVPFPYLRQLAKLRTLGFGPGVIFGTPQLEELFFGPDRLELLKAVIFDQVQGRVGWRVDTAAGASTLDADQETSPWLVGDGWILPEWAEYFSEGDVMALVERIKTKGIEVKGKTLDAFGVKEEWQRERKARATIDYGDDTEDSSE